MEPKNPDAHVLHEVPDQPVLHVHVPDAEATPRPEHVPASVNWHEEPAVPAGHEHAPLPLMPWLHVPPF